MLKFLTERKAFERQQIREVKKEGDPI